MKNPVTGTAGSLSAMLVSSALLCALASCVDIGSSLNRHSDVSTGAVGSDFPEDWKPRNTDSTAPPGDARASGDQLADGLVSDAAGDLPPNPADAAEALLADSPDVPPDASELQELETADLDPDACVPDCIDKKCGSDGCGGQCGYCPESKPVCSFGVCKACKPDCGIFECGPDGCGGSCGACPAKFACVGGFCKAPACQQQQVLFLESFDSCTQGAFDIIDDKPEDPVTWWSLPLKNHTPPCALFLGDPDTLTYETGGSVHLELLSPELTLEPGIAWRLTVRLFFELEPVPSPLYPYDYDVLYLRFLELPSGEMTDLWSTKEDLNSSDAEMKLLSLDLSDVAGKTGRFVFEFDTVDSVANGYPGVYLDDFRIDVTCPYCSDPEDCGVPGSCVTTSCEPFANVPDVGACWEEPIADCCNGQAPEFCDDLDPCTVDSCSADSQACAHEIIPDCPPPRTP